MGGDATAPPSILAAASTSKSPLRTSSQPRLDGPLTMPVDATGWWEVERARFVRQRVAALDQSRFIARRCRLWAGRDAHRRHPRGSDRRQCRLLSVERLDRSTRRAVRARGGGRAPVSRRSVRSRRFVRRPRAPRRRRPGLAGAEASRADERARGLRRPGRPSAVVGARRGRRSPSPLREGDASGHSRAAPGSMSPTRPTSSRSCGCRRCSRVVAPSQGPSRRPGPGSCRGGCGR